MENLRKSIEELIKSEYPMLSDELNARIIPAIGLNSTFDFPSSVTSKFGGFPDINKNFKWPTFNGRPLSFVAQIDFAELGSLSSFVNIPSSGVAYFFLLTELNAAYPSMPGQYLVYYQRKEERIEDFLPASRIDAMVFKEAGMGFYPLLTFLRDYEYNEQIDDVLDELTIEIERITGHSREGGHQIGGHPFSLQNPVTLEWTNRRKSLILNKEKKLSLPSLNERHDHNLLLQLFFGDDKLDFSKYGGQGMAYYGISKRDLDNLRFNKSVLTCQND